MLKRFLPVIYADSVFDIDLEKLKNEGVKAFIFDIDNTVATYAMPVLDGRTAAWLKGLSDMGFGVYFVSNNSVKRVRIFAESAGVPYIGRAMKPLRLCLRRACRRMGVKPQETALVGDQLFTDIWGGNRMGMVTVLVNPISVSEDSFVHLKRGLERRILKKAGRAPAEKGGADENTKNNGKGCVK